MKRHLQWAEQQDSSSNVTKYCTCHAKWLSWVMSITYETSFTMRGATGVIHQRHQVLRLPRKMTRIIDPRDIWKSHLQCAEQQMSSDNVTKYCACHVKWHASLILVAHETAFTMRGATGITLQPHQILRLPRKIVLQNLRKICRNYSWSVISNARPIRPWSEHDIRPWNCKTEPVRSQSLLFPPRQRILYWKLQHFALRLSTQISPNTAPATKSDTARSPNTAPATKSDSRDWSSSHMKRHLHCAEQQDSRSPSNVTKYCACHAKWLSWLMSVTHDTSFTMRGATDLILQHHQMLHLPRKTTRIIYPRDIWNDIYNAQRNRHHPPTSPNTAPATQNDSHAWSSSHMERHLQCAEQQASPSNLTKYCACHAKVHSKI